MVEAALYADGVIVLTPTTSAIAGGPVAPGSRARKGPRTQGMSAIVMVTSRLAQKVFGGRGRPLLGIRDYGPGVKVWQI